MCTVMQSSTPLIANVFWRLSAGTGLDNCVASAFDTYAYIYILNKKKI